MASISPAVDVSCLSTSKLPPKAWVRPIDMVTVTVIRKSGNCHHNWLLVVLVQPVLGAVEDIDVLEQDL
jgi:hypothetical protein